MRSSALNDEFTAEIEQEVKCDQAWRGLVWVLVRTLNVFAGNDAGVVVRAALRS